MGFTACGTDEEEAEAGTTPADAAEEEDEAATAAAAALLGVCAAEAPPPPPFCWCLGLSMVEFAPFCTTPWWWRWSPTVAELRTWGRVCMPLRCREPEEAEPPTTEAAAAAAAAATPGAAAEAPALVVDCVMATEERSDPVVLMLSRSTMPEVTPPL